MHLAALGPQMLRLAGEAADGVLLNWATPGHIAVSRARIDEGAARAGRAPGAVPVTMYIRVCVDDDVAAARQALGQQVLGYALGQPGVPQDAGYRGLFGQMGFEEVLRDLEARRDGGAPCPSSPAPSPNRCSRQWATTARLRRLRSPSPGSAPDWTRLSSGSSRPVPAWNPSSRPWPP